MLETTAGQHHTALHPLLPHLGTAHPATFDPEPRHPCPGPDLHTGVEGAGQQAADQGPAPDRPPEDEPVVPAVSVLGPGLVGGRVDPGLDPGRQGQGPGPERPAPGEGAGDLPVVVRPAQEHFPAERRPRSDLPGHPAGVRRGSSR